MLQNLRVPDFNGVQAANSNYNPFKDREPAAKMQGFKLIMNETDYLEQQAVAESADREE